MSGNRGHRDSRPDPSTSRGNDGLRRENDPNQRDTRQLTALMQTTHLNEASIPAHAGPPSMASSQQYQQPTIPVWRPQQFPAPTRSSYQSDLRHQQPLSGPREPPTQSAPPPPPYPPAQQDKSWTAEQMDRMTAYKKEHNNARWTKVAHDVGGGHTPVECENKWLKMERVRMRKELEEKEAKGKEGKGKESKKDRSPDTEDKEDRAGPPRQRQRK